MPGSSVRVGRAEAATRPKATSGHPAVALRSRDCLEKGCLEMKLGELGVLSDGEGVWDGKYPEVAGALSLGGRSHLLRVLIAAPLRNTGPKGFQSTA